MTDNEFDFRMELIRRKDKNGLSEIYNMYGKLIYQLMLGVVKSPQDAEDLTSDFFLRLWDTADSYRKGNGHKRYISVMARNLAIDFLRRSRHEIYSIDDEENPTPEQADSIRSEDSIIGDITFDEMLSRLKNEEREIINLHLGMELTFQEISKILSKPLGTVAWKYRQAILKLRKTVKEVSINE